MSTHSATVSPGPPPRIEFAGGGAFYAELKERVQAHVSDPKRARRARRALHLKSVTIAAWAIGSWYLLVFVASSWWQAGLLAVSLGLAVAGIGFGITHDANHGTFSSKPWFNRAMRWSLDVIGGSSYVWRVKHNVVHHTYTNIVGVDSDIEVLPLARLAPEQPLRWFHRFQHMYLWILYGLLTVKWQTLGDFDYLRRGKVGETPLAWPKGGDLVGFWIGKVVFFSWTLGIPLLFHPVWQVFALFGIASFVLAETLSVTFQLAHCLEEAEFPTKEGLAAKGRPEWARHQVETTVDFAQGSRALTWYMGGLNFQIEHHLFSRVCHTHYPSLAPIVREVCAKHGVRYETHTSLAAAIASHGRWLRQMGRPEPALAV